MELKRGGGDLCEGMELKREGNLCEGMELKGNNLCEGIEL